MGRKDKHKGNADSKGNAGNNQQPQQQNRGPPGFVQAPVNPQLQAARAQQAPQFDVRSQQHVTPQAWGQPNSQGPRQLPPQPFPHLQSSNQSQQQFISQQIPPRFTQQAPQGYTQQAPPGYTQQAPQGYTQQAPQGYTQQAPQGYTQQAPQGYTQQAPQGYTQQAPPGYTQQAPQGYTQQAPPGYTQQAPQGYTQQAPQGFTQQPLPGYTQQTSQPVWGSQSHLENPLPMHTQSRQQSEEAPSRSRSQSQSQHSEGNQKIKVKGNKYPKKEQPPAEPAPPVQPDESQQEFISQMNTLTLQSNIGQGTGLPQVQQAAHSQNPLPMHTQSRQQSEQAPSRSRSQSQSQHSEGNQKIKVKGNKYPKKEQPPAEPAPPVPSVRSTEAPQQTGFELPSARPTKALCVIESSPDGSVYQGKRGMKCTMEVNYLKIAVEKMIPKAFHYDVEFDPDVPKKLLPKALEKLMQTFFSSILYAFDGRKNFYTNKMLEVKGIILDGEFEKEVEAVLNDRRKNFKVKVKFATEVDLSVLKSYRNPMYQHNDKPSQAIQCLDVILRTVFKSLAETGQAVAAAKALYFATNQYNLGEGMEMWLGLFQSAVLGRSSLYLNVDVAHKAFPSALPLLQVLASFDRNGKIPNELSAWQKTQLKEYLKMLSVGYRVNINEPMKTFGFNDLVNSTKTASFVDETGKKMTVLEYFKNVKRINLRFPDLPCLHVGSKIKNIYLPLELCEIPPGQATNKKCTPTSVAAMIKYSATSSDERKKKIQTLLNKINYADKEVKGFGIEVGKNFQNVEGRVLDAPQIKYIDGNVRPQRGVWNGKRFLENSQTAPVKWAILNCDRTSTQEIMTLTSNISRGAHGQGMNMLPFNMNTDYAQVDMNQRGIGEIQRHLEERQKKGYKLVIVIIQDKNDCYAKVKQAAELKVGILTQCIKSNTIFRMGRGNPMMTIGNILLKVNAKLNGKNHEIIETSYTTLNAMNSGIMFVGADVTHPSPDQRDIPSVVGVAASHDHVGFRYQCAWRIQDPKKEMIEDLENILVEQLKFYESKNKKLPGKLMYYRDGVSEGQFLEVLNIEMSAIKGAMRRIYGAKPHALVTFIVVQKRHHTRFFPTNRQFSDGKNNNIIPGTVVDKDIVHPFQYQFFLASHAAIQGVTKPAKYCVLINESKILPDDLQAITYDLCHLFTRCNRSVSYPAPTYYAHLVAARGKSYTIGSPLDMSKLKQEYERRQIKPAIVNNNPMFFV